VCEREGRKNIECMYLLLLHNIIAEYVNSVFSVRTARIRCLKFPSCYFL